MQSAMLVKVFSCKGLGGYGGKLVLTSRLKAGQTNEAGLKRMELRALPKKSPAYAGFIGNRSVGMMTKS